MRLPPSPSLDATGHKLNDIFNNAVEMFSYGNDLCVKAWVRELFGALTEVIYTGRLPNDLSSSAARETME